MTASAQSLSSLPAAILAARILAFLACGLLLGALGVAAHSKDKPLIEKAAAADVMHERSEYGKAAALQVLQSVRDMGTIVLAWNPTTEEVIYVSADASFVLGIGSNYELRSLSQMRGVESWLLHENWQAELAYAEISRANDALPTITIKHAQRGVPVEIRPKILMLYGHCVFIGKILSQGGRPHMADMLNHEQH